ncbi:MAG: hypothetical protein ACREK8_06555, partial [Gemmatimonadales bacterium]
ETIDSRIWPRLAAIAERFWSPGTVNDVADMYRRLDVTSQRLAEFGLRHEDHGRRMMRRIAGDSAPLFETLLDYVRPRDFGGSGATQLVPHARLIDAAVADPRDSWNLRGWAARAGAGDASAAAALQHHFARMAGLYARLLALKAEVPAAEDGLQVAAALADLGRVGGEALDFVIRRAGPDARWRATADSTLAGVAPARIRQWQLRPVGVDAVRLLVDAAKGLPPPNGSL